MSPSERQQHHIGQEAARTAAFVSELAQHVHVLAAIDEHNRAAVTQLARIVDVLAIQARAAATAIGSSLATALNCAGTDPAAPLVIAACDSAVDWTGVLKTTLDSAIATYAIVCDRLADSLALTEEHTHSRAPSPPARLTARELAQHSRTVANWIAPNR